ncbi:MAG: S-layer protein [Candidatus Micrarchaeota archaeon]|nr:S-layer protein [Candidatus Micrarchaeota archaeon]
MKIKKILALGALGLALVGGTVGAATLSDFVQLDGSTLTSPTIVIGDTAKTEDVIAGIDIGAAMAGFATKDVTTAGSSAMATVTGGKDISTTSTKIYLGDQLSKSGLRSTLTASDMPTVLASGTFTDGESTEYTYDQYIAMGSNTVTFGNDDDTSNFGDSAPYINLGSDPSSNPVYTAKVVFNKPINLTSSDVKGQEITLFGKTYTIGQSSTATTLHLQGGANKLVISEDQDAQTVKVNDVEHTVKLVAVSGTDTAVLTVDGQTETVTKQSTKTFNGALGKISVYLDDVYYNPKQGTYSSVKLSLGSEDMYLQNGYRVRVGSSDYVKGTKVTLTGNPLSTVEIAVSGADTTSDWLKSGSKFTDPVFGTFALSFGGATPDLEDSSRTTLEVTPSGRSATLKFTDYRGYEKSFVFAYDNDTSTSTVTPVLEDASKRRYYVIEGEAVSLNEYVVLSQGEFSHLYQVTSLNNIGDTQTADATVQLTDVFSGETTEIALSSPGYTNATAYIDGQTYYVNATSTNVKFTWGSGASVGNVGSQTTVFPGLWGKNGEYVVILDNRTFSITNGTSVYMPGSTTAQTLENTTTTYNFGQVTYVLNWNSGTTASLVSVEGVAAGSYPLVLVVEEKGKDTSATEVQNAFVVPTTSSGTSTVNMGVSDVTFTDSSAVEDKTTTDTDVTYDLDRYGTFVKYDSSGDGKVTAYYPDEQVTMNVAMGSDPVWSVGSGTDGGTYKVAVPIQNPVAKFAAEVDTSNLAGDLILVGGPCVNDLVKTLLAPDVTCQNWPYTTGIVKVVENAFNSGHKALIVAGTSKEDTRNLADNYVMKGTLAYEE